MVSVVINVLGFCRDESTGMTKIKGHLTLRRTLVVFNGRHFVDGMVPFWFSVKALTINGRCITLLFVYGLRHKVQDDVKKSMKDGWKGSLKRNKS